MDGHNTSTAKDVSQLSTPPLAGLSAGLARFWQAYLYARDADADVWDFALERDVLYEAGLTNSDLRWLVAKGFVQHGPETTVYGAPHRSFRPGGGFNFVSTTCLVLTRRGAALASDVLRAPADSRSSILPPDPVSIEGREAVVRRCDRPVANKMDGLQPKQRPHWNPDLRELRLADQVVKRFRVPARNQEMILSAFEEEGWPEHIDDPLPFNQNIDPRTRLHDAINRLNGCQAHSLLRFRGNGRGTGVSWKLQQLDASWRNNRSATWKV